MADYDFRGLSPIDFEALVRDLLGEETGLPFTTFAVGPDGGIDCRHTGDDGVIVAQCKHRPDAKRAAMVTAAKGEGSRLQQADDQLAGPTMTQYYFVTSASLSPNGVDEVAAALGSLVPDSGFVWTRGRLNQALTDYPNVERRHFKLWLNSAQVFDRIVGSGEWERNESLVRGIREHVEVWVHTPKYSEALDTLSQNGVVIISGAPGVGKSTLAEMLLLTHWEAGFKVVKITSDIADAWKHLRDSDERVIFYYDDFLGQTSSLELQKNESNDLGQVIRTLQRSASRNALLVMTTREQILNTALHSGDDRITRALEGQGRIRVELAGISRGERALMLINHLYFAYRGTGLLPSFADDTRYRKIIDHAAFNPRILESVVLLKSPLTVDGLYSELLWALDHPEAIWAGSFQQLSALALRIVLILAIEPERVAAVEELEKLTTEQDDPRDFVFALKTLEDTWIRIDSSGNRPRVRLYDPSRRDFLLDQLAHGPIFSEAMRHATSPRQIEFLLRQQVRTEIAAHIEAATADVEDRAVQLLGGALMVASAAEAARARRGEGKYRPSETYRERMDALIATVGILSRLPAAKVLRGAVEDALKFLEGPFDVFVGPTASDAFALATALDSLDEEWAQERAEAAAVIGVYAIDQIEELRDYADLDWDLRHRIDSVDIESAIEQAFQDLVDNVTSGSEKSTMLQVLDDIDYLASELHVAVNTDDQRDYISDLREDHPPGHYDAVTPLASRHADSNSDEAIASLFESLRAGDE